ncbi:MAG: hypothetical protein R3C56_34635 [Pirellulaceae bacterium]
MFHLDTRGEAGSGAVSGGDPWKDSAEPLQAEPLAETCSIDEFVRSTCVLACTVRRTRARGAQAAQADVATGETCEDSFRGNQAAL